VLFGLPGAFQTSRPSGACGPNSRGRPAGSAVSAETGEAKPCEENYCQGGFVFRSSRISFDLIATAVALAGRVRKTPRGLFAPRGAEWLSISTFRRRTYSPTGSRMTSAKKVNPSISARGDDHVRADLAAGFPAGGAMPFHRAGRRCGRCRRAAPMTDQPRSRPPGRGPQGPCPPKQRSGSPPRECSTDSTYRTPSGPCGPDLWRHRDGELICAEGGVADEMFLPNLKNKCPGVGCSWARFICDLQFTICD